MKPILILGLGNLLQGDDGVGCRVAQELEKRALSDTIQVIDGGTPGIGLLNLLEGHQRAMIIDAAEMGIIPGEFKRLRAEDVLRAGAAQRISLHHTGITDTLALARELRIPLPEIVFFGVQPALIDWADGLSPQVQAAVPHVIDAILSEIGQACEVPPAHR